MFHFRVLSFVMKFKWSQLLDVCIRSTWRNIFPQDYVLQSIQFINIWEVIVLEQLVGSHTHGSLPKVRLPWNLKLSLDVGLMRLKLPLLSLRYWYLKREESLILCVIQSLSRRFVMFITKSLHCKQWWKSVLTCT